VSYSGKCVLKVNLLILIKVSSVDSDVKGRNSIVETRVTLTNVQPWPQTYLTPAWPTLTSRYSRY